MTKQEKPAAAVKKAPAIKKVAQKKTRKKAASRKVTEAEHQKWLFAMDEEEFVQLQRLWNQRNLRIKLKNQKNYDEWLNYWKTLSPNKLKLLSKTGLDILPTEAYSALIRWMDIMNNPARIDKLHQSGLTNPKLGKNQKSIVELALSNDRLGVLKATRDQIAEKLQKGAGARDTAALAREMTEIMTQIADYEKRQAPKRSTKLGALLQDAESIKRKRPAENGGGSRHTKFSSRITIEDVER